MKKFFKYLFLFIVCFSSLPVYSAETNRLAVNTNAEQNNSEIKKDNYSISDKFLLWGRYFNNTYEGDKIDEDFSEDVHKFFPQLNSQEVSQAESLIRHAVKIYRWGEKKYNDFMAELNRPIAQRIYKDEEYAILDDDKYIDLGEKDKYLVTTDIKKVVAYSKDDQDKELMSAKRDYDKGVKRKQPLEELQKIKELWSKGYWRALLFYNLSEDDQKLLTGLGNKDEHDVVAGKFVANYRSTKRTEELKSGIAVYLPYGRFVVAENTGEYTAPIVDLSLSENITNSKVILPVPLRFNHTNGKSLGIYTGTFLIPVTFDLKDKDSPINIVAKTKVMVCDYSFECKNVELNNTLYLDDKDDYPSEMFSFIEQSFYHLPENNSDDLVLKKAVIDTDAENNDYLRLEFFTEHRTSIFSVFAEGENKTELAAPAIAINGKNILVRFKPVNANHKFTREKYTITALLNKKYGLRQTVVPKDSSIFDPQAMKFSLGLLFFAFIGGLLLNLMPCIFPVLALKIIALSKLNRKDSKTIKHNLLLSALGIICGFLILATILAVLKIAGYSLGWGMQFQSYIFLGIMIFILLLFIAQVYNHIDIKIPGFLNKYVEDNSKRNDFFSIMTGMFIVLMATPCSAPFLGLAVGFALGGTILHIYLILFAVALGVACPYLLFVLLPKVSLNIQKGIKWQKQFIFVIKAMLFITLIWLCGILSAQIGLKEVIIFTCWIYGGIYINYFGNKLLEFAKYDDKIVENKEYILLVIKRIFIFLTSFCWLVGVVYLHLSYNVSYTKTEQYKNSEYIDFDAINEHVKSGKTVLLEIGANWCLTCKLNELTTFNALKEMQKDNRFVYMRVDWSMYNQDVLDFMAQYGRRGLPFYVIYNQAVPDGLVLPEILTERQLKNIISNTVFKE